LWQIILTWRDTHAVKFQLTQDVFDALIPAGSLGYLPFMDEGLIGLAGVVSSVMGGYTQWRKTKWSLAGTVYIGFRIFVVQFNEVCSVVPFQWVRLHAVS
jgi:hypothetical protein